METEEPFNDIQSPVETAPEQAPGQALGQAPGQAPEQAPGHFFSYLFTTAGWKWTTLFIFGLVGTFVLYGISSAIVIEAMPGNAFVKPVIALAVCCALLLLHRALSGWFESRKVTELSMKRLLPDLGFGLALGAAFFVVYVLISMAIGSYRIQSVQFEWKGLCISFFSTFLLVAVAEEIISRAVIYRMIEERWGSVAALVLSCLFFGFIHILNPNASLWSSIAIMLAATESAIYFYTKTLWAPIGLHWTWNFFQGNVFGFPVSGQDAGATIITPEISGPDIITGGGFGPEASIITVVLSAALAAWLIYKGVKKGNYIPGRRARRKLLAEPAPASDESFPPNNLPSPPPFFAPLASQSPRVRKIFVYLQL